MTLRGKLTIFLSEFSIIRGVIILLALIVLIGCSEEKDRSENSKVNLSELKIGEVVYVCGCPMMCCNSLSRNQNGRCSCNVPLKPGIVSRIQDSKVYVKASGREKLFIIPDK